MMLVYDVVLWLKCSLIMVKTFQSYNYLSSFQRVKSWLFKMSDLGNSIKEFPGFNRTVSFNGREMPGLVWSLLVMKGLWCCVLDHSRDHLECEDQIKAWRTWVSHHQPASTQSWRQQNAGIWMLTVVQEEDTSECWFIVLTIECKWIWFIIWIFIPLIL